MIKIANYQCDLILNDFLKDRCEISSVKLPLKSSFDHEILIWNNTTVLSDEVLHSFPKLKLVVTWCVENKNIECEKEIERRGIMIKSMDILLSTQYDKKSQKNFRLKSNILTFFLRKYLSKDAYTVFIARHGETQWNLKKIFQGTLDSPLTIKGTQHAHSIASYFFHKNITSLYSSPLSRAQQTAKIIATQLQVPLKVIPSFKEMHFGIFQGKKESVIKKRYEEFFVMRKQISASKLFIPYPGGESYLDVYNRVIDPLMTLLASYNNFVIVGHESANRTLRGIIEELPLEKMIAPRQKNNQIIVIDVKTGRETEFLV